MALRSISSLCLIFPYLQLPCLVVLKPVTLQENLPSIHPFYAIHYFMNISISSVSPPEWYSTFIFQSNIIQAIWVLQSWFCAGVIIALRSVLGHAISLCGVFYSDNFQPVLYGAKPTVYFLMVNVYWADVCLQCSPSLLSRADKVNAELYGLCK